MRRLQPAATGGLLSGRSGPAGSRSRGPEQTCGVLTWRAPDAPPERSFDPPKRSSTRCGATFSPFDRSGDHPTISRCARSHSPFRCNAIWALDGQF
jgi:hypothetical protein